MPNLKTKKTATRTLLGAFIYILFREQKFGIVCIT
jgi:hypothetical protein